MTCPKCQSENVQAQIVSETKLKTKHHSFVWWFFVGWWWETLMWLVFTIPKLIFTIFRPKKYKAKTIHETMWICQSCGYHWKA